MFKTLKTKIFVTVAATLFALITGLAILAVMFRTNIEELIIKSYFRSVSAFAQQINRKVVEIENNVLDMAAFGEVYYRSPRIRSLLEAYTTKIFENYEESTGGGIWYEPYSVNKNQRLYCVYAYRNAQKIIVKDSKFEEEDYDYLNQIWYGTIKNEFKKKPGTRVVWSSPYYENIGSEKFMVTAGAPIYNNGSFIGMSTVDWGLDDILTSVSELKPTPNSFTLFADKENDYIYVSTDKFMNNPALLGKSLKNIPWYREGLSNTRYFKYNGKIYTPYVKELDNGMVFIVNIPKNELFGVVFAHFTALFTILFIFCILLCASIYRILRNNVIRPIDKLIATADRISAGDNNVHIEIANPEEFSRLASTFDKMITDIRNASVMNAKSEKDLSVAKSIQTSSLPSIFPAFPSHNEFDIYANMTAAKAVGGDFYDFFFIDAYNLMFLVADVSGKGIPAALFMMRVKTLAQNIARTVKSREEMIKTLNAEICSGNRERLFVTMFIGILNIYTGELLIINCGHNPPLFKSENGDYKYYDVPSNIVLGAFADAEFKTIRTFLAPGDTIFAYTDGVTEATNSNNEIYGVQRFSDFVNANKHLEGEKMVEAVKNDIDKFSAEADYSDDITMLILKYNGCNASFELPATRENYHIFYGKIHEICDKWGISKELYNKIDMCSEEIFANVAFYAYPDSEGKIRVSLAKSQDGVTIEFSDEGIPYNPLEKPDPDITLRPEERPIGGLGIFIVKQLTQKITYKRENNKNVLILFLAD